MNEHSFIKCEAVKTAYRQNKTGIVVSFLLHPNDFSSELALAPIGTRVLLAVAELGEIESGNEPEKELYVAQQNYRAEDVATGSESDKRDADNF